MDGMQGDVQRRSACIHAGQLQLDRLHRVVRLLVVVRAAHSRPAAHQESRRVVQRDGSGTRGPASARRFSLRQYTRRDI